MPTVADVAAYFQRFAPSALAAEWDNVGLLLGDSAAPAERILTCLTVTPNVVAEAVAEGVHLIVSHHPILFRGAKKLSSETTEGRLLLPLMRAGIAVYSPHTSFDNCSDGINDNLAARFGLRSVTPLRSRENKTCKLAVFVPETDLAKVSDAMFAAGAGCIGRYEQCSYRTLGTGTFFGTDGTNPTIGQVGRREEVAEWRLEVILPQSKLRPVIAAMRNAHSYEEPAFDVYPLVEPQFTTSGEGRFGEREPISLGEFAKLVKESLRANTVMMVGEPTKVVRRVAIACGAAGEFLNDAIRAQADVFIVGELRFHDALTAETATIGVLVPGHYATERPAVEDLATRLQRVFPDAQVWASRRETDPFSCV